MPTKSTSIKIKQVLWFITLWCLGSFSLVLVSSIIRFMMAMAGLRA